jgi:eukaryotic-like serine/threonine-protein kinase
MADSSFYKQTTLPGIAREKSPQLPLPSFIGPYKIESLLNRGGMSLLYLGLDAQTKQTLAIKVLSPEFVNNKEAIDRFLKEAQIIGLTNHPNIVKLYGEGEWEGGLYIAMELIRGISLKQFIIQQSLSLKRCLEIILQVAYALSHLHAHGVIHRDLKPENILITENGDVKVIDFGIAQLHEEEQKEEKEIVGTPDYMSPEQKQSPSTVTFSSDIYSLGIITYELVLGKLSYGMINLSLLPPILRKIVGKAIAVSRQERYQDIIDFITDITQYLKTGEWEKERPGSDASKEILELLQRTEQNLSPLQPPAWPAMDIGMAKSKGQWTPGFYCDFFKLPNNLFLIILAETLNGSVDSSLFIANLRGMIRMLVQERIHAPNATLASVPFVTTLNQQLIEDKMKPRFGLSLIVLDPLRDQLAFTSCGLGFIFHLPQGASQARKLTSSNPLLGADPVAVFTTTTDNWKAGDSLYLHSLPASSFSKPEGELEKKFIEAISENAFLSPQNQAEAILKKLSGTPSFSQQMHPKHLISIHRIS